ncbi:MAG: hypothetical protein KDJ14_09715 [Xanthomonadales bacterium]|nr:hypothetical protein [Xanthomonadales bacterium]
MPRAVAQFHALHASSRISRSALVAVVALHAALIYLLASGMRAPEQASRAAPFVVEWIARRPTDAQAPVPPWPVLPERSTRDVSVSRGLSPASSPDPRSRTAAPHVDDTHARPSPLFDQAGRPRLWEEDAVPAWTDSDRVLRDRIVRLPGDSDAQAAYTVRLRMRQASSPQHIVGAVLRLLFGTPARDDCRAIEQRLLNSDPGVSREIDLVKLRKTCAGTP